MATDFFGLPTRTLESKHPRLEYLTEAGPRIVRLFLGDSSQNLLVELPNAVIPTPVGDYHLRGGHRLWHAPEVIPRTYVPDDAGLEVAEIPGGVRLIGPTEASTGMQKSIEIQLSADRPVITLRHLVRNDGVWPVELAPWAITQLPLGGMAILPQQAEPLDAARLLPNRQLVIWPYTRWSDSRLQLGEDYILLHAQPLQPPCKIGYLNRRGWVGYLRHEVLFVKRFAAAPAASHVDFGCNAESYCNDEFIEVETIGPLAKLDPGQSAEHVETWEIYAGVDASPSPEGVRALVQTLGLG